MNFSLQTDTLAFQTSRPGMLRCPKTDCNVKSIAYQIKKFQSDPNLTLGLGGIPELAKPEDEACHFYMLNHAMAIIRRKVHPLQPLENYLPIAQAYSRCLTASSIRMFFYLLLICTRESRHVKNDASSSLFQEFQKQYGFPIVHFHNQIRELGSLQAADRFLTTPPDASLGKYTEFLWKVFAKGSYSSSFGGPKWASVAKPLHQFVSGSISAEMMLDTSFTLAHNGGPIFNKGMLYGHHTHLIEVLDIQSKGGIPAYVAKNIMNVGERVKADFLLCKKAIPDFGENENKVKPKSKPGVVPPMPPVKTMYKIGAGSFFVDTDHSRSKNQ